MIRLRAISKAFRDHDEKRPVFENIDLDLPAGRCIGVVGDRGAGKSTLLRLLCGLEQPDQGSIESDARVSIPLGQSPGLTSPLTGRENANFVARTLGMPPAAMVQEARRLADLGNLFDLPVAAYPRPCRQRLNFAIILAARYDVYLADEQVTVVERVYRDRFLEYFEDLKRRAGVIIASSKPKLLSKHCDSVIVIANRSVRFYEDIQLGLRAYCENSPRFADQHQDITERRRRRRERRQTDQESEVRNLAEQNPGQGPNNTARLDEPNPNK